MRMAVRSVLGEIRSNYVRSNRRRTTKRVRAYCATPGSVETGTKFRHPIPWTDPKFYDKPSLEREMRRVFDVCHGCRLCYNLCNSFPRLFDLIDDSKTGELDSVDSGEFKKVVDDCTLCDVCAKVTCPYVPPHPLNVDFPHLMLRYRAVENVGTAEIGPKNQNHDIQAISGSGSGHEDIVKVEDSVKREIITTPQSMVRSLMTDTDMLGYWAAMLAPMVNWISAQDAARNFVGIHKNAKIPLLVKRSEQFMAQKDAKVANKDAPAFGKYKVALYATCIVNNNKPDIGTDIRKVLQHNGVQVDTCYTGCCGMPQFESGKIPKVVEKAKRIAKQLVEDYVKKGFDIIAPVASCCLMFKKEWPLLLPEDENVIALSKATFDASEYLFKILKAEGLVSPPSNGQEISVTLHHACHSRAQEMGFKSLQLLKWLKNVKISSIERCSGHGGSFGVTESHHKTAMKVGKPVFRNATRNLKERKDQSQPMYILSDCPLAVDHIKEGVLGLEKDVKPTDMIAAHPMQLVAKAYGLDI